MRAIATALILMLSASALADDKAVDPELRTRLKQAAADSPSFVDRFDAEVWLTDMSGRLAPQVPDSEERILILKTVHAEATRVDLPPELVLAVIDVESNFDRLAVSHAGAAGLMQVMLFWRKEIGRPDDNLVDIGTNLRYGCTILRYYMDRESGDLQRALARYNGSVGKRWYPDRVLTRLSSKWFQQ